MVIKFVSGGTMPDASGSGKTVATDFRAAVAATLKFVFYAFHRH